MKARGRDRSRFASETAFNDSGTLPPGSGFLFSFVPILVAARHGDSLGNYLIYNEEMVAGGGLEPPTCGL